MIFQILGDVFEDHSDDNIKMLDKILPIAGGRHVFYINDYEVITKIRASKWFGGLRPIYQKEIEEYINLSSNAGKNKPILIVSNSKPEYFSLVEAEKILREPLTIVLENVENDAYFIEALIKNFKKDGEKLRTYLKEDWVRYGGGAVANFVQSEKQRIEQKADKFPKDSFHYLRLFVLLDSDKTFPTENLKQDKINQKYFLERNEIQFHVLEKREMENYMPDEAFSEIPGSTQFINAYLRLSPPQKDFFDIEKGWDDKNFNQFSPEIQHHYSSVPETDRNIFRKQKMELKDGTKKLSFKSGFPKLFQSEQVTRKTLLARCNSNELQEILEKITKLL